MILSSGLALKSPDWLSSMFNCMILKAKKQSRFNCDYFLAFQNHARNTRQHSIDWYYLDHFWSKLCIPTCPRHPRTAFTTIVLTKSLVLFYLPSHNYFGDYSRCNYRTWTIYFQFLSGATNKTNVTWQDLDKISSHTLHCSLLLKIRLSNAFLHLFILCMDLKHVHNFIIILLGGRLLFCHPIVDLPIIAWLVYQFVILI